MTDTTLAPQAIELCKEVTEENCTFHCQDFLSHNEANETPIDVLLVIDVFEHVPDYLGFLEKCKN